MEPMDKPTQTVVLNKYLPDELFKVVEDAQKQPVKPVLVSLSYVVPYELLKRLYDADKSNLRTLCEWSCGEYLPDDGKGHAVGQVLKSDLSELEKQIRVIL